MIKNRIIKLQKLIKINNLDGYIIPKNDAYFSEHSSPDRLRIISNFSGSSGFAVILKKENYLFIDGRYTIQAQIQSGKYFKIIEIPKFTTEVILKNKKLILGFDPQLFTSSTLKKKFSKNFTLLPLEKNLVDKILKNNRSQDFSNRNLTMI